MRNSPPQISLEAFWQYPKTSNNSNYNHKNQQNELIKSNNYHFKFKEEILMKRMPIKHEIHAENYQNMKKYLNKLRTESLKLNKMTKKQRYSYQQDRSKSCMLQKQQKMKANSQKQSINDFIILNMDKRFEKKQNRYDFPMILHNQMIKNQIKGREKSQRDQNKDKFITESTKYNQQNQPNPIQLKRQMRYRISRLPQFRRQSNNKCIKMSISVTGWKQSQQKQGLQLMDELLNIHN